MDDKCQDETLQMIEEQTLQLLDYHDMRLWIDRTLTLIIFLNPFIATH